MTTQDKLFVGLMSGTSADSIDAALVASSGKRCRLLSHHNHPLSNSLKTRIHALTLPGEDEIARMGALDQELGEVFAEATQQLLANAGVAAHEVTAIGSHGQTVRHQAALSGGTRFSLQIANPHVIAERTGILTIADFRRRDIACGGQGAPLAPGFHQAQFSSSEKPRCVVNIGGISNITNLPLQGPVIGFDTGPGNTLMDAWIYRCQGKTYDQDGTWAASAAPDMGLLNRMLQHPFLQLAPPKSTGREDFNLTWLADLLKQLTYALEPVQVQATLLEFTSLTIAQAINDHADAGVEVFVCGGGAHNQHLLARLSKHLPDNRVATTEALGLDPDWVEAVAFAWLAEQYLEGKPGNLPSVTGAEKAVILGAAYPGAVGNK